MKIPKIKTAIVLCLFLLIIPLTASAAEDSEDSKHVLDENWEDAGSATLYQGDTHSIRGYIVEVVDFDKNNGQVLITLTKDDILLNSTILNATSDEFNYDDKVKIEIEIDKDDDLSKNPTIWKNPRIHMQFFVWKEPRLSLDLSISRVAYRPPDSDIFVTVKVKNNGESEIENVDLHIDPDRLNINYGRLKHHFGSIEDDESESVSLKLGVPRLLSNRTFTISANASGISDQEESFTASDSQTLNVLPICDLKIKKLVTNTSMDHNVWVSIEVENTGIVDLNLTFMDTIPQDFKLLQGLIPFDFEITQEKMVWRDDIAPGEKKKYKYYMTPLRPGVFSFCPATAEWKLQEINYSITSNTPVMAVDGAYIVFNKTASPAQVDCGEHVNVNLSVVNIGNKAATITIHDVLPEGTELIRGNTTLQSLLNASQAESIEYVIRMDTPGNITFPHPKVELVSKDYCRMQVSDSINIEVSSIEPLVNSTLEPNGSQPGETREKTISGLPIFEIAFAAFLIILALLIMRYG